MSFGVSSLKKTTPQIVKNIRDSIIYAIAGCLAFTSILAPKLGMDGTDFATWNGFIIFGVKVIAKFFGVNDEEAVQNVMDAVQEVKETTTEIKKP